MSPSKHGQLLPEHFTAEFIDQMRGWLPAEAATACDDRVRAINQAYKLTFIELGQVLVFVESNELWKHMAGDFRSFNAWLQSAAPACHSTACAAFRAVTELREIPVVELQEMTQANVCLLAKVAKTERAPEVIKAAKQLNEENFTGYVQRECPNSHISSKILMRLRPDDEQAEAIKNAIEMCKTLNPEIETREAALQVIALEYGQSHLETYRATKEKTLTVQ